MDAAWQGALEDAYLKETGVRQLGILGGNLLLTSTVPGSGEAMDIQTLADPNASLGWKIAAGGSLAVAALFDGFGPNAGGVRNATTHGAVGVLQAEGKLALRPGGLHYDPNLVPGPNPNGLRQRAVTSPTAGEGGVYLRPEGGKTKIGSTGDFQERYGPRAPDGIEVEIPQTRQGPPSGVADSAYPWTARAQRRFDEAYVDRLTPANVRYRAPDNPKPPVSQENWDLYRHIFGYGDLPSNFGN
jgi:hypothetical protein